MGGGYVTPYVSLVYEDNSVNYNVFKAQLTLANKRIITVPQKGNNSDSALTSSDVSAYKDSVVDVVVGNRIKTIGGRCFSNIFIKLTSIKIPDNVTSFGTHVFYICPNLKTVKLPSKITSITHSMFQQCYKLLDIDIPNTVTSIAQHAFYLCYALTSITIPSGVTNISNYAFLGCSHLSSVTVLAITPPTSGAQVFNGNASGRKIYVPSESLEAYKTATNWSAYASAIYPIQNE